MNNIRRILVFAIFALSLFVTAQASTSDAIAHQYYLEMYGSYFPKLNTPYEIPDGEGHVNETTGDLSTFAEDYRIEGKNDFDVPIIRTYNTSTTEGKLWNLDHVNQTDVERCFTMRYICSANNAVVTIEFNNEQELYEADPSFEGSVCNPGVYTYSSVKAIGGALYTLADPSARPGISYHKQYSDIVISNIALEKAFIKLDDGSKICKPGLMHYEDLSDSYMDEIYLLFQDLHGETYPIHVTFKKSTDPKTFVGSSAPEGTTYCKYKMQMVNNDDTSQSAVHPLGFTYNSMLVSDEGETYYLLRETNRAYKVLCAQDRYGNSYVFELLDNGYTITTDDGTVYSVTKSGITKTYNDALTELVQYSYQEINSEKDTYDKYDIDNEHILTITKNSSTANTISDDEENVTRYYTRRAMMYNSIIRNGKLPAYYLPYKIEFAGGLTKNIEYTGISDWRVSVPYIWPYYGTKYAVSRLYETDSEGNVRNDSIYSYHTQKRQDGFNYVYIAEAIKKDMSDGKEKKTIYTYIDDEGRITAREVSKGGFRFDEYEYAYLNDNSDSKVSAETITRNSLKGFGRCEPVKEYRYLNNTYLSTECQGNYNVTHTYHTNGNYIPHTTTYKRDANTTVRIENLLTEDKKSIATTNVYENDVLVRTTSYTYDSYGNVASESVRINDTDTTLTQYTYAYDDDGGYTLTTVVKGVKDADNNPLPDITAVSVYDCEHNLISSTDANGNTTSMTYDRLGRLLTTTYPDGTGESYVYDISDRTTIYTAPNGTVYKAYFDAWNNITRTAVILNGTETALAEYTYDDMGNVAEFVSYTDDTNYVRATYTYDYLDRVLTENVYNSASETPIRTATYEYSMLGASDKTPLDIVTVSVTGDGGTYAQYKQVSNYRGFVTEDITFTDTEERKNTYTHDYMGNVVSVEDAIGNITSTTYDAFNNPTSTTYADGSVVTTSYNTLGLVSSQTNAIGGSTEYVYDNAGRLIRLYEPLDRAHKRLTKTYYDGAGNVASIRVRTLSEGEDEVYSVTDNTYDTMNRLISSAVYPSETEEIHTRYEYDIMGNPTKVTSGLPSATSDDSAGQSVLYEYDSLGRLIRTTSPDGMSETAQYDLRGRVVSSTDKAQRTTNLTYDAFDNIITRQTGTDCVSYTYNLSGQRTSMTDSSGVTNYTYNPFGSLTSETKGDTIKAYTYDRLGRPVALSLTLDDDTEQYSYTYDAVGRLTALITDDERIDYTYDASSNLITSARNGIVYSETEYNEGNLPIVSRHITEGEADTTYYVYNADGNLAVSMGDHVSSMYLYDGVNRLVSETTWGDRVDYAETFAYDTFGNRISSTHRDYINNSEVNTSYTYNNLNQLVSMTDNNGTTTYTYDASGNMTSVVRGDDVLKSYAYDVWNRLIGATANGNTAVYTYNGDNLRQTKTVNGITTRHVYNGADIIADVSDTATYYIRGNGLALLKSSAGTQLYSLTPRGDVRRLTDSDNADTEYFYTAYGEDAWDNPHALNPFGYTGEYTDFETGLIYLRNRYYDPEIGIFITQDPARDGFNWYAYCAGNPVMFVDPIGFVVTEWDRLNCSLSDLKKLEKNDIMWNTGNEEQKVKAADSSRKIREKYLEENEMLLDNGYVRKTFDETFEGTGAGGSLSVNTNVTYSRLYKENEIYIQITNIDVSVKTQSGFYVKNMIINCGQGGLKGTHYSHSDAIETKKYSYSPKWGMVLDDGGAAFTVAGVNVSVEAYRGTSNTRYDLQVINNLYYREVIYNGKNFVQGIDFYDTMFDIIFY